MKIYEAFKQALKEFQIPAKKAAEVCGVTQGFMSLFLAGKRSTPVENLEDWLERLEAEYKGIKCFFYSLLYNYPQEQQINWRILINNATPKDISEILNLLSKRYDFLRASYHRENTEECERSIAV
jgi:hypothetical protein